MHKRKSSRASRSSIGDFFGSLRKPRDEPLKSLRDITYNELQNLQGNVFSYTGKDGTDYIGDKETHEELQTLKAVIAMVRKTRFYQVTTAPDIEEKTPEEKAESEALKNKRQVTQNVIARFWLNKLPPDLVRDFAKKNLKESRDSENDTTAMDKIVAYGICHGAYTSINAVANIQQKEYRGININPSAVVNSLLGPMEKVFNQRQEAYEAATEELDAVNKKIESSPSAKLRNKAARLQEVVNILGPGPIPEQHDIALAVAALWAFSRKDPELKSLLQEAMECIMLQDSLDTVDWGKMEEILTAWSNKIVASMQQEIGLEPMPNEEDEVKDDEPPGPF